MTFEIEQTVRFQHCDPAGIVFYPRYYEMLNLTVERFFEERIGRSFNAMQTTLGVTVPTVRMETDFLAVSTLEDRLALRLTPERIGRSSLALRVDCVCEGEMRLRAAITLVCINLRARKAAPWPDALRARIEETIPADPA